jgi:hypothetical protein
VRRATLTAALALLAALAFASAARAAAPAVSSSQATNIQGVSALLKGTVDPEGLATTYRFEYSTSPAFSGSSMSAAVDAGSGSGPQPARVAIAGLQPSTTYHVRLRATNADGTTVGPAAGFATTQGFGFLPGAAGFDVTAWADGGGEATLAGSHPYRLDLSVGLNLGGEFEGQPGVDFADGDIRDLRVDLPAGLIFNPNAIDKCTPGQFNIPRSSPFEESRSGESCPERSQVGTIEVHTSLGGGQTRRFGLFNLVPPTGVPAQLGASPFGAPLILDTVLRPSPEGTYALAIQATDIPQTLDLSGFDVQIWGTPWGATHDGERGSCLNESEPGFPWAKCSAGEPSTFPPLAFVTLPTECSGSLDFQASARAWQQPAQVAAADSNPGMADCDFLALDSDAEGQLTSTNASTSTGYNFRLSNDAAGLTDPLTRNPSQIDRAVVELPDGVTLNPSLGAGLETCSPAGYAAETAFNGQGSGCPNGSKIGDFLVFSALYDGFLRGAIYLAEPRDNRFGSLLAVYLVAKQPERGLVVKVAGELRPDPGDGTITAIFDHLPQLPYTDLEVNFRTGQRAPLVSPPACGPAVTKTTMTPWSGAADDTDSVATQITGGIGGGACPSGTPPFDPGAVAGGVNANVGSYTPYYVHLSRKDTEQEITSYSLVLPKGVTGKLAGIPFCSDAAIERARGRDGFDEIADPSCPAASQVGRTNTGYGVGSALTYAPGRIYLAGPYKGEPLSLVTINAATVGPFDLGTIVIRSAFSVNPRTAQLQIDSSASDPIPHILEGVPLHLREVRIHVDRFRFTRNPSSCRASQMVSTLTGSGARLGDPSDDTSATVGVHYQLLNCLTLGFRPRLGMQLRGGVRRNANPALRAVVRARARDSSPRRVVVTMPRSLFLAQDHIRQICTRPQFAADRCPRRSIYGRAVVHTDLFDEPLRGPVLLRSSDNVLPDLVASLHSGEVRIVLEGRIGPSKAGGIRAFFDDIPDAPINRFVMQLNGGRRGLLANSVNICLHPPKATVKALGQNNIGAVFTTRLRGNCKKFKRQQKRRAAQRKRRRAAKRRAAARRGAKRASLSAAVAASGRIGIGGPIAAEGSER